MIVSRTIALVCGCALVVISSHAQQPAGPKEFPPGLLRQPDDLPASRFRTDLERLPAQARERAVAWLGNVHFTEQDLPFLHADSEGGVFYADPPQLPIAAEPLSMEVPVASASLPVSPFPASLRLHSRPGAPNVLYLDFDGESVRNTAWNNDLGRTTIEAAAFSSDSDHTTFSDAEQLAIRRIWQRVAEDYAPFNVDVTTERPATFNARTAHAVVTRNTDASGAANPASNSGGVAYVNVFGSSSFAMYRPAWIYHNNLGNEESYVAEAVSHELGHNLGLSHDGKTDGADYYGGHGSGETSWGPIMGTGYGRNVSQWSKGEYHLANNTQDDLATIAGKLSYRTDDHGNSSSAATPLVVTASGLIVSTSPEIDPANSNASNKGLVERPADTDVFSFVTGSGLVRFEIKPWAVPSALYRGGNLDLVVELYNSSGQLLLANNAANATGALLETNLAEGAYYLHVRNTGVGTPLSSSPSGYTAYGSIGQYFISGTVVPSGVAIPPTAQLTVSDITEAGSSTKTFTVRYSDNAGIDVSTLGNDDLIVSGANGYSSSALLVSIDQNANGTPRIATYSIPAPSGAWASSDAGLYTVLLQGNSVSDIEGAFVAAQALGSFRVDIPQSIYAASMDSNPGWTFQGLWQYGAPRYGSGGPSGGATGANIVAYNLSGNYENRLNAVYATTPTINSTGATSLTLRFRRWLRVRNGDTAVIQASTNGTSWVNLWSTTKPVADNSWQEVQYALPSAVVGSPSLRFRWGLASGPSQNEIGWNIDDVVLLGNGAIDATAPSAALAVANLVSDGSPAHSLTVTYSDNVAVKVSTIDSADLLVLGPNGYSNRVELAGIDTPLDGAPRTALYSVPAPRNVWDNGANGVYEVHLQDAEVSDLASNRVEGTLLGTFTVAIPDRAYTLVVEPSVLAIQEGGNAAFTIRLNEAPDTDVTVTSEIISGDSDIQIVAGATHTFTPLNWAMPVPVLLVAALDADHDSGSATIHCRGHSIVSRTVIATEIEPLAPEMPSLSTHFESSSLSLSFNTVPGVPCVLEQSATLSTWLPIETNTAATTARSFRLPIHSPAAFYRVLIRPE